MSEDQPLLSEEQAAEVEITNGAALECEAPDPAAKAVMKRPDYGSPAQVAREQIQMVQDLRAVIVANTRPNHWIRWSDERVVPDGPECLRLRTNLGIRFAVTNGPTRTDHQDADGPYYVVTVLGRAAFVRRDGNERFAVPCLGICSNRHPFFARAHGKDKRPTDINPANIYKMAWTECIKDGVRALIALVLDADELPGIQGRAPKDAGAAVAADRDRTGEDTPETRDLRMKIKQAIIDLAGGKAADAIGFLVDLTTFKGDNGIVQGKKSVGQLTAKQVQNLWNRREKDLTEKRFSEFLERRKAVAG